MHHGGQKDGHMGMQPLCLRVLRHMRGCLPGKMPAPEMPVPASGLRTGDYFHEGQDRKENEATIEFQKKIWVFTFTICKES